MRCFEYNTKIHLKYLYLRICVMSWVLTTERLIQLDLPNLLAFWIQGILQIDFCWVICVRAKLHGAVLPVEREICYLDTKNWHLNESETMSKLRRNWMEDKCIVDLCKLPWLHRNWGTEQGESRLPCHYYKPEHGHAGPHQTVRHYWKQNMKYKLASFG